MTPIRGPSSCPNEKKAGAAAASATRSAVRLASLFIEKVRDPGRSAPRGGSGDRKVPRRLRSLLPGGHVPDLLRGRDVDRDAHRRELQAGDLAVDLLGHDVDLRLQP